MSDSQCGGHPEPLARMPRRRFLSTTSMVAGGMATGGLLSSCSSGGDEMPSGDGWRRFAGTTINFGSENSAPTAAIAANLEPFKKLTGIDVKIATFDITSLAQVISLDFASGAAQYDVVYMDPWMMLAPLAKGLADLREFTHDDSFPQPKHGLSDFVPMMLDVEARYESEKALYTLPYDAPTLLLHYRKDLFDKYHDRMRDDLGFDPTPGLNLTWEQYYKIGAWFNKHVHEVDYGIGLMAKQHDSLACDYGNVMWAYGGDYFRHGKHLGLIGSADPGKSTLGSDAAQEAAAMYLKLASVAHPSSPSWDWDSTAAALRGGAIGMCANWHENAAGNETALPGKIGYAPLPTGPKRSANMFAGTGIGVNDASRGAKRGAAWLFVNWATSPSVQLMDLKSSVGGGTPTRTSVYELPQVKKAENRPSDMPNMLAASAVEQAWQEKNIGIRPKIPMWQETLVAFYTGLSKMLANHQSPSRAMPDIAKHVDRIVARGWKA